MDYPFPFLGVGDGRSKTRWVLYLCFREVPSEPAREDITRGVPSIVAHEAEWDGPVLRCSSDVDVEYDVRLAAIEERAAKGQSTQALVVNAYDKASDSARSPAVKQWRPFNLALDRWVLDLAARHELAFCIKTNNEPSSEWHTWSLNQVSAMASFLGGHLNTTRTAHPWRTERPRAAADMVIALGVALRKAKLSDAARASLLDALRTTFDSSERSANVAGSFIGELLARVPSKLRRGAFLSELERGHGSIVLAACDPALAALTLEDEIFEALIAILETHPERPWLASHLASELSTVAAHAAKQIIKEPPLWRVRLLDRALVFVPDGQDKKLAEHARPVLLALAGETARVREAVHAFASLPDWGRTHMQYIAGVLADVAAEPAKASLKALAEWRL